MRELPFFLMVYIILGLDLWSGTMNLIHDYTPMRAYNLAGRAGIMFLYDYAITLLVWCTGSKTVKVLFYALVLCLFGFRTILLLNFDRVINLNIMILLVETNSKEASEFLRSFLWSAASIGTYRRIVIRIVLVVLAEWGWHRYFPKAGDISKKRLKLALTLPTAIMLAWGIFSFSTIIRICRYTTTEQFYHKQMLEYIHPEDPISTTMLSLYGLRIVEHEMHTAISTTKLEALRASDFKSDTTMPPADNAAKTVGVAEEDSLDVVLIVGESFNKWHSELYGYGHVTTPNLSREAESGHLFVFKDAVAPYCLTSPAMKALLSCNCIADGEDWSERPYFPAIFKAAGYSVYFWDNQKGFNPTFPYTLSLNSYLYDRTISELSYTAVNDTSFVYDGDLVDDFERESKHLGNNNLVMFHLMGQHFIFNERYPHNHENLYFTADSIHRSEPYLQDREKRQSIADYDNAVRYNDLVVRRIIDLFRQRNAVVVFMTDHGEEIYDYKDAMYRDYEGHITEGWARNIHNIPFVVWCSDQYVERHHDTVEALRVAVGRPFTTDNVCQLLFDVGSIRTTLYIPDRDVISPQFRPRQRLIEDILDFRKYNYDDVMAGSRPQCTGT